MIKILFKSISFLLLLLTVSVNAQQMSDIQGNWVGFIETDQQEMRIEITFTYSDRTLDGLIDIPDRGTFTIPVEVVDTNNNQIVFQYETGHGPAVFYGSVNRNRDKITGEFEESGRISDFTINKSSTPGDLYSNMPESDIKITAPHAELAGSLVLRNERSPIVILVAGSGENDRNLDIGGFQFFRNLSERLYEQGYSSFRYDAPGIGGSTGDPDVTLSQMSDNLVQIIQTLRREYSEQVSGFILLGHNQGGLVSSQAASEVDVDGIVLAAAPFVSGEEVITQQIQKISEVNDIADEIVKQNLAFQEKIYKVIREEGNWEEIEDELELRLRAQIEELPLEHQNALGEMNVFIQSQIDRQLNTAKSRWFKSWIEADPLQVYSQLNVPVLALFGEKDSQILPQPNLEKARLLVASNNLYLQTIVIQDANHLFQEANTGMPTEYGMLQDQFADRFLSEIDQFIRSLEFQTPN